MNLRSHFLWTTLSVSFLGSSGSVYVWASMCSMAFPASTLICLQDTAEYVGNLFFVSTNRGESWSDPNLKYTLSSPDVGAMKLDFFGSLSHGFLGICLVP